MLLLVIPLLSRFRTSSVLLSDRPGSMTLTPASPRLLLLKSRTFSFTEHMPSSTLSRLRAVRSLSRLPDRSSDVRLMGCGANDSVVISSCPVPSLRSDRRKLREETLTEGF